MKNAEPQPQMQCTACDHFFMPAEILGCSICKLKDICKFCLLPVEGQEYKQCVACCIPMCYDCGWYEGSPAHPSDQQKLAKREAGYKTDYRCPNPKCGSSRIMAIFAKYRYLGEFSLKERERQVQAPKTLGARTPPSVTEEERKKLGPWEAFLEDLDLNPEQSPDQHT